MTGMGGTARATPDAPAIVDPAGVRSHVELDDRARAVAGFLAAVGLKAGDRVAILSGNRAELIEVVAGSLRSSIIPVPINPLLSPPEVAYIVEDSGAGVLFADRPVEPLPGVERVVIFGDAYERCLHEATPSVLADFVLGRPMHYTSGTTGRPKGVWVAPLSEGRAAQISERFRALWALAADDIHLVCSPLAHSAPLRFALRTLEAGGAVALLGRFDARAALAAIELYGITTTFMVPTHLERIVALGHVGPSRHDLSSLRLLAHAGAPIRRATKEQVIAGFPADSVWEFYGSTEGHGTRISSSEWMRKPGSVGTAGRAGRIIITDGSGRAVAPIETGDVWIDDPDAERFEYWKDPAKTRAAWRGGAFNVGDLGYLDADGYLFLAGRKHDTIITGGVNVYPQEVERVLAGHPAVAEVVAYGAPDDEWGQRVHAAVVPAGDDLDPDALAKWAKARLAGFKCPHRIVVVSALARTPSGKLIRREPDSARHTSEEAT